MKTNAGITKKMLVPVALLMMVALSSCTLKSFTKASGSRGPASDSASPSGSGNDPVAFFPSDPVPVVDGDGNWLYPTPTPSVAPPPPPVASYVFSGVGQ